MPVKDRNLRKLRRMKRKTKSRLKNELASLSASKTLQMCTDTLSTLSSLNYITTEVAGAVANAVEVEQLTEGSKPHTSKGKKRKVDGSSIVKAPKTKRKKTSGRETERNENIDGSYGDAGESLLES